MKTRSIILAATVFALLGHATSASAQVDPCPSQLTCQQNPDADPGAGGGVITNCYKCRVDYALNIAFCASGSAEPWTFPGNPNGRTLCEASNSEYGPPYCQLGGGYCYTPVTSLLPRLRWDVAAGQLLVDPFPAQRCAVHTLS